jgi:hypothetical protein
VLRDHFQIRNAQGNKKLWRSSNFWAGIAKSTALSVYNNDYAFVAISNPAINQKVYGGTIKPASARGALAIPLTEEAYKAGSPREGGLPELFFMKLGGKDGRPVLASKVGKKGLRVDYLLVKNVTQSPDPDALPDQEIMQDMITNEVTRYLARLGVGDKL